MMKTLFTLLLAIPIISFSQTTFEKEIDSITTTEAAEVFIKRHKTNKGKLFTFNKEKHKTRLAEDLFNLAIGGKEVIETDFKRTYYKVIAKDDVLHHRASYIYFDGSKMTLEEIDKKRKKIISQYKDGYKFDALAKLHSMDTSAQKGGDLGWFAEGVMYIDFENAVKQHNVNDIFTLDITDKKWYYIILKTYEPTLIEEITVLKITEDKD